MNDEYRIHVTIRKQGGSVFNSDELCTELYDASTAYNCARQIANDIELWIAENINAAEEFDDADN